MADTHETIADIIAEMRDEAARADMEQGYSLDDAAEMMREFASRIEAAHKRERGDSAKLREALDELVANIEMRSSTFGLNVIVDTKTYLDAKAALAAPPRNCDVYSADELKAIFKSELVSELPIANEHEKNLVTITAMGVINTLFATATEKKGLVDGNE